MQAKLSSKKAALIGGILISIGPITLSLYAPAMPVLAVAFETSEGHIQASLTAYFAAFALTQLVCGPLSDAIGRKPAIYSFLSFYLLATLSAMLAPSVIWLIAARALQGAGAAVGISVCRAIIRDCFDGKKAAKIYSTVGIILAVAPTTAPFFGGLAIHAFGWKSAFWIMFALGSIILLIAKIHLPETLDKERRRSFNLVTVLQGYRSLLREPAFVIPSLMLSMTIGTIYTNMTILPFVLIDRLGYSPAQFGIIMIAQSGMFLMGSACANLLLRRLSLGQLYPPGLIMVGTSAFLLMLLPWLVDVSAFTIMGPVGLATFGFALIMPPANSAAMQRFRHMGGTAASLMGFFQMCGGFVGSALAITFADPVTALRTVIPLMGMLSIILYFCYWLFDVKIGKLSGP